MESVNFPNNEGSGKHRPVHPPRPMPPLPRVSWVETFRPRVRGIAYEPESSGIDADETPPESRRAKVGRKREVELPEREDERDDGDADENTDSMEDS